MSLPLLPAIPPPPPTMNTLNTLSLWWVSFWSFSHVSNLRGSPPGHSSRPTHPAPLLCLCRGRAWPLGYLLPGRPPLCQVSCWRQPSAALRDRTPVRQLPLLDSHNCFLPHPSSLGMAAGPCVLPHPLNPIKKPFY